MAWLAISSTVSTRFDLMNGALALPGRGAAHKTVKERDATNVTLFFCGCGHRH